MTGIKIGSVLADGTPVAEAVEVAKVASAGAAPSPTVVVAKGEVKVTIHGVPAFLTADDVRAMLNDVYHLTDAMHHVNVKHGLPSPKHEITVRALEGVLRHGVATAVAASQGGTKERRDALRLQSSYALTSRPTLNGVPHFFAGTELADASKAPSIRNMATQDQLHLLALGILNSAAAEAWYAAGSETFRNTFEKFGDLITHVQTHTLPSIRDSVVKELRMRGFSDEQLMSGSTLSPVVATVDDAGRITDLDLSALLPPATAGAATTSTTTTTASTKEAAMSDALVSIPSVNEAIKNNKFSLDPTMAGMLDGSLRHLGLPSIEEIGAAFRELAAKGSAAAPSGLSLSIGDAMEYKATAGGTIPSGKCVTKKAAAVFGLTGKAAGPFNMDVPVYEWDAPHPHVPAIDPGYQFQPVQLLSILVAIVTNQRAWLYGDTGCGKTTLIEQVAARLNYPVIRVNFDSEITRMDLIGAKDIIVSGGHPVTTFTEGVLPSAMQMPCIFLADELDFIRADVAYVFQRALEGNGLTLPEDAGRIVNPHPGFRIFATANTQGQGDETGRYQGAKPQSAAFLDRFTMWIQCGYMNDKQVEQMLAEKNPSLPTNIRTSLTKYAREHWTAFMNGQVLTALSPRGLLSCAMTYTVLSSTIDSKAAFAQAMERTFVDRASPADAQTIKGLITRVVS
jgi:cobaltochelatase CobS subunit